MVRLGAAHNRRANTLWTVYEAECLAALEPLNEEELTTILAYYTADIPESADYRRRDLATLLNNWTGELDRARKWQVAQRQQKERERQERRAW